MDTRRARILIGSIVSTGLLMSLVITPAAAACALSAPSTAAIGFPIIIEGSGFPASGTVDVSLTMEGGSPDEFSVQTDASGSFQLSLTPEASDTGVTNVVATSGSDCTAHAVIAIGVEAVTEAPTGDGGAAEAPPRTDTGPTVPHPAHGAPSMPSLLAGALFLIGIVGVYITRPLRSQ